MHAPRYAGWLIALTTWGCTPSPNPDGSAAGGAGGSSAQPPSGGSNSAGNASAAGASSAGTGFGGATSGGTSGTTAGGGSSSDLDATPGVASDAGASAPSRSFVYVSGYNPQISVFTLDPETGAPSLSSTTDAGAGAEPTFIAFSPDKNFAYAVDEQLDAAMANVIAFAIDQTSGALTEINRQQTGASIGAHVAVHPNGQWVFAANYGGGSVSIFAVRNDGGLEPATTPVAAGGQAHQIVFDSTGSIVFVPCVMAQHVALFDFSAGALVPHDPATVPIVGGPRSLAFTTDERFAYVLTQDESTITSFTYDAGTATLTSIETIPATPSGGSFSAQLHIHPSGKFLYASNRMDNGIASFAIDQQTGQLTEIEQHREMLDFPRSFAIDPSGRWLLIGNQHSNSLVTRRIDQLTGQLAVEGVPVAVAPEPTFVDILSLP